MKEIGKLLELLNQYLRETKKAELYDFYIKGDYIVCDFLSTVEDYGYVINSRIEMDYGDEILISKSFGFIKWLVENDKIDFDKCGFKNEGLSGNWYDKGIAFVSNYDNDTFKISEFYSPYLQLLMLLSISDTPIEDLLLYLK